MTIIAEIAFVEMRASAIPTLEQLAIEDARFWEFLRRVLHQIDPPALL